MKDDPVFWLAKHLDAGIHLREEARRWLGDNFIVVDAWEKRVDQWERELIDGIKGQRPRDAYKVSTLDEFRPLKHAEKHPFYDPTAVGIELTSTGEGQPGNDPLSRLDARIKLAQEVLQEWEQNPPTPKEVEEHSKKEPGKVLQVKWAKRMGNKGNRPVARQIAKDTGLTLETIEREARKSPAYVSKRPKSGKKRVN